MLVDLRSDTVTRPTPAMRRAMAEAEVGDDVYGEDPTVRSLEERAADLFGFSAALYVPSGTMGNQIAVRLLAAAGEELLADADAHVVTYEGGGLAAHGGVQTRTLVSVRGLLAPDEVAAQVRPRAWHMVRTAAVSVENTHNRGGGAVYPLDRLRRLREVARGAGAGLHCDGARIWNAHVATRTSLPAYGELFDTMSVCLSKGLGAPVGSVVLCSAEARETAWGLRHRLGGNMRQAGVIAAGGRYALDHHVERLAEDHARAGQLAAALGAESPETNIVLLDVPDAPAVAQRCREQGVLVAPFGPGRIRLVTHLDVDDAGIEHAIKVLGVTLGR
ncbi:MAG: threonine aldolase family protein [Carbonactinosporaceae bacterium]